ncbi:hypothetical protein MKX01_030628 [Papaver californicum]|nr:hypothetical protein MKX01_030628 [Papaver californicum]
MCNMYMFLSIFLSNVNMSGRGGAVNQTWDIIVPPESQPNPSILRLNSQLKWENAREPLRFDIYVTQTCGIGLGMSFANTIGDLNPSIRIVGFVPCAVGGYHGTKISEWAQGTPLYNSGILWFQGESDMVTSEDTKMYSKTLKKLIMNLRADRQLPIFPFIQQRRGEETLKTWDVFSVVMSCQVRHLSIFTIVRRKTILCNLFF